MITEQDRQAADAIHAKWYASDMPVTDRIAEAIAQAREEGRRQGIEAAAQVADAGWKLFSNRGDEAQYACEWVETEIRALAKG